MNRFYQKQDSSALFKFKTQQDKFVFLGTGHITAALYCGSPPVIIDPGVSAFGPFYYEKIQQLVTDPSCLIIALTHSHFDHCGAAPYLLRKIPGATVAASTRAADILNRPNAVSLISKLNAEYEQEYPELLKGEDVSFNAVPVARRLNDGDVVFTSPDGETCVVFSTPGHTRDSMGFYFTRSGALFTGDAGGTFEDGMMHSPFLTDCDDYLNSLDKIIARKPDILCIAHNGILTGDAVNRFLKASKQAALNRIEQIGQLLRTCDGDMERVVNHITQQEYDSKPDPIQKREPFILNLTAMVRAVAKKRTIS